MMISSSNPSTESSSLTHEGSTHRSIVQSNCTCWKPPRPKVDMRTSSRNDLSVSLSTCVTIDTSDVLPSPEASG